MSDYEADALLHEIARLKDQLADVMRAGDLEHARMAALYEACEVFAQFVEAYPPNSPLARGWPTFYGIFRVYGKNARAAARAVRPQADALLARLADLSRQIGEQNTTIGYQDAMLSAAYNALMSYAHGNSAPDLAAEVAAHLEQTIGKARE